MWNTWLQRSFLLCVLGPISSRQMMQMWSARCKSSGVASRKRCSMLAVTRLSASSAARWGFSRHVIPLQRVVGPQWTFEMSRQVQVAGIIWRLKLGVNITQDTVVAETPASSWDRPPAVKSGSDAHLHSELCRRTMHAASTAVCLPHQALLSAATLAPKRLSESHL